MDTYYDRDHKQEYGLWRYKDKGWEPRPGFYSWSLLMRYTKSGSRVVAVEVVPPAHGVRSVALRSPDGANAQRSTLTVLVVNRYNRSLQVTLETDLRRKAVLHLYRYTRETVSVPGGKMLGVSETLRVSPNATVKWTLLQRGGSSSPPVILSAAKNLSRNDEILRCAQNDRW